MTTPAKTKILVADAIDTALDWLVAKSQGLNPNVDYYAPRQYGLSDGWRENDGAGPPIKRYTLDGEFVMALMTNESISVIRCDDKYGTDSKGFTTNQRIPVWAAAMGHQMHSQIYGSQGDDWGTAYAIDIDSLSFGETPFVAVIRCYLTGFGVSAFMPTQLTHSAS